MDFVTGLDGPCGLDIDPPSGKLYWVETGAETIKRIDVVSLVVENLITSGLDTPDRISLDPFLAKIYFTNTGAGTVERANVTGLNREVLVSDKTSPVAIHFDAWSKIVYWSDTSKLTISRLEVDTPDTPTVIVGNTGSAVVGMRMVPACPGGINCPAVSTWGLFVLALAMLTAATALIRPVRQQKVGQQSNHAYKTSKTNNGDTSCNLSRFHA